MANATPKDLRLNITTGVGIISFPHVFKTTAETSDDGSPIYSIQLLIPKSDKETLREILGAIKKVAEARWGSNWRSVRNPLRDGDAEADDIGDDGKTKREKYPERLGHYFINAKTYKPVGVYDRKRELITDPEEVYPGCKGKLAVLVKTYGNAGNNGVHLMLNGVQKVADGEPLAGGARPDVVSMFDIIDDDDFDDLDDVTTSDVDDDDLDDILEEAPKKKASPKKKAAPKKKKAAPVEEDESDDFDDFDDFDDSDL